MALDWNKDISFGEILKSFGKKGKTSKGGYPTKTTINLYVPTNTGPELNKVIPAAIALAIAVGLFTKFGVFDQLARVSAKEGELGEIRSQISVAQAQLSGYDELLDEYESYAPLLSASGVDASEVLSMVETYVMPRAAVASSTLEGATLTLNLVEVPLDMVGEIVNTLQEQAIVESVAVTTAQNDRTDATSTATLQVALVSSSDGLGEEDDTFFGIDPNASAEAWGSAVGALSNK